jgi:hypothetical protein
VAEVLLGVRAEQQPLEDVATPLSQVRQRSAQWVPTTTAARPGFARGGPRRATYPSRTTNH